MLMNTPHSLQVQWYKLLSSLSFSNANEIYNESKAAAILDLLASAYNQSGRYYHNLSHVEEVLGWVELLGLLVSENWDSSKFAPDNYVPNLFGVNLAAVKLAVWFHDAIYETSNQDNEFQSAEFASNCLQELGVEKQQIERVRELILLTQHHQVDSNNIEEQILLDADLAVLGGDWEKYWLYAQNIRQEYNWVGDRDFKFGRIKVLEHFLNRPQIFFLLTNLEDIARQNLTREIEMLRGV